MLAVVVIAECTQLLLLAVSYQIYGCCIGRVEYKKKTSCCIDNLSGNIEIVLKSYK